uniref:Uncharacterized protein n=1 Tax=Potsystermes virus TaxID=2796626 RepID=A0A7T7K9I1_9VIRU|nr:hypothetical protein 2 [Potsystermes virus]
MSEHSSSDTSQEASPTQRYRHEHPVLSYALWRDNEVTKRMVAIKVLLGNGYNDYISFITEEAGRAYRHYMYVGQNPEGSCTCLYFKRRKTCYHNLTDIGRERFTKEVKTTDFRELRELLQSEGPDDVDNFISTLGFDVNRNQIPPNVRCQTCSLVLQSTSFDVMPKHKCQASSAERYGLRSVFRYKLPFRTPRDEVFEISEQCVILGQGEFKFLVPLMKMMYEELERLEIQTTFVQLLYQDPMFYEIFGALETFEFTDTLGTYVLYLYTKFRLIPYLKTFAVEDLAGKLNPVPVMFVSEDKEVNQELLGYDREEKLEQGLIGVENEVVERVNHLKDDEDHYVQAIVCDGILSKERRKVFLEV